MPRGGCAGCGIPSPVEDALTVLTWVCAEGWSLVPQAGRVSPVVPGSMTSRARRVVPFAGVRDMLRGWDTGYESIGSTADGWSQGPERD